MNHFDMTDFRLFVQIAEANSLRKGAEFSCLSAGAASARIANMEARTGTRLLVRSSKGVSLTTAGQAFLHHAKLILAQVENLNADLEGYAGHIKGHLRLAANPTAIGEFLPRMLRTYMATHPDVRLDMRELFGDDIIRSVSAGNSDIGIVMGQVQKDALEVRTYWRTRLAVITPTDHPLAKLKKVSFAEALQYEFVDFIEGSPTYGPLHQAADALALPVRTQVRAMNLESCCRLVEAGIGIGVAPEQLVRSTARAMEIAIIPISAASAVLTGSLCARNFKALPAFARDFVNLLMNEWSETAAPRQL